MMGLDRRQFVKNAAVAGLALGTPIFGSAQNKTFRTALVGSGWWGMNILGCAIEAGRSKVTAICDVDQNQLKPAVEKVTGLTGSEPNQYSDFREMLAREKPEIVIVGTPDHWHPLVAIAAVDAGAHVYVEKPISHTILEGRAMVKAARKNDRVVQVGTHRRASPHNISAMEFLKAGKVGEVGMVRAFVHSAANPGQPGPVSEPPPGLDWNMWCGPAPYRPFDEQIHPKGFRHFLDYANGTIGDWGIHWLDQILWWTEETFPRQIFSTGGRYFRQDNSDAPDCQVATYQFEKFTAVWEHRRFAGNRNEKHSLGCYFYGTEGVLHLGWRDGWTFYPRAQGQAEIHVEPQLHAPDTQNIRELWADFLDSIDAGRRSICDIEIGHRSTTMSLLGMISLKVGRSIQWDGDKELVVGDEEANKLLRRDYRAPWVYPQS